MAIGERIRYFRKLLGVTQKSLGCYVGFTEKTADIRIAQYESGARIPKEDVTEALAYTMGVSSNALTVPNIDDSIGLMHTLFVLEDLYGLTINRDNGVIKFRIDPSKSKEAAALLERLPAWCEQRERFLKGEIKKEEYDFWRYNYSDGEQPEYSVPIIKIANDHLKHK